MENEKSEKPKTDDEQKDFDIPKIVGVALRKCHHTKDARQIAQNAYKLTVEERMALMKFFECKATDLVFEIKKFWLGDNFVVKTKQDVSVGQKKIDTPVQLPTIITCGRLSKIIKPKDHCDKVSLLNVAKWIYEIAQTEEQVDELSNIVFALAKEANAPTSKNPIAVFMSSIKSQLGYVPPTKLKKTVKRDVRDRLLNG